MAQQVAVIGAGLMGAGIAQVAAAAGYDVVLRDVTPEALERGLGSIRSSYAKFVEKGRIGRGDADAALGRHHHHHRPRRGGRRRPRGRGRVREARGQGRGLPRARPASARTARCWRRTPPPSRSPRSPRRPRARSRVVGTHFFSPVPMMKLCELVRGYKTSDETLAAAREFAEGVGKTVRRGQPRRRRLRHHPPHQRARDGGRRACSSPASRAPRTSTSPAGSASATRWARSRPIDLTGVDIMLNATSNVYADTQDENFAPPELLRRMVAAGDLGRKSGRGFYDLRVIVPTHRDAHARQALADADVRRPQLGDASPTRSTGATSRRARPGSRSPSTCRRRPATTPTTCSRAARSARSACRCRTSATCARCSTASRSTTMNTSMTINATAMWLLALYATVAEEQGADARRRCRARRRTTSSRSTSPAGPTSSRPGRRCG